VSAHRQAVCVGKLELPVGLGKIERLRLRPEIGPFKSAFTNDHTAVPFDGVGVLRIHIQQLGFDSGTIWNFRVACFCASSGVERKDIVERSERREGAPHG
jgi:hypothetical protein